MEWTGTLKMDTLGSLYGSDNPTTSGVLCAGELINDAMMYSDNASSCTLSDAKCVKAEADPPLLFFPYTCTNDMPYSTEW